MSHPASAPETLELVIVQLANNDRVEALPLPEESDRLACQRIRPARRRRLFHFRRSALLALLARLGEDSTILRDAAGHVRALLGARGVNYVSASASEAFCAMTLCPKPVGIDIERADGRVDLVSLLDFVGAPCAAGIATLPPDIAAFEARMAWTRLEAGLKQVARGMHDYLVRGPAALAAGQGAVHVLATFDWVCAVVHAGDPIEITARLIDFRTLCDE